MLQGKSALITGSLGGIGFEIAAALARQGCNVLINGFGDEALIQNQLQVLRDTGAQASTTAQTSPNPKTSTPWSSRPSGCTATSISWSTTL